MAYKEIIVTLLKTDGSDNEYEVDSYFIEDGQLFNENELLAEFDENNIDENYLADRICNNEHDHVIQIKLDNKIIYLGEAYNGEEEEELGACDWCEEDYPVDELQKTDVGMLCDRCIRAVKSRGEEI